MSNFLTVSYDDEAFEARDELVSIAWGYALDLDLLADKHGEREAAYLGHTEALSERAQKAYRERRLSFDQLSEMLYEAMLPASDPAVDTLTHRQARAVRHIGLQKAIKFILTTKD